MPRSLSVPAILLFLTVLGCGGSSSDASFSNIEGKVSYQGEPVKNGVIYFEKIGDKETEPKSAPISDGAYSVKLKDGKYTVRISGTKVMPLPKGVVGASGEKEGPKEYLPARFNAKSDLTADIAGPRTLDFPLK